MCTLEKACSHNCVKISMNILLLLKKTQLLTKEKGKRRQKIFRSMKKFFNFAKNSSFFSQKIKTSKFASVCFSFFTFEKIAFVCVLLIPLRPLSNPVWKCVFFSIENTMLALNTLTFEVWPNKVSKCNKLKTYMGYLHGKKGLLRLGFVKRNCKVNVKNFN